MIEYTIDVEAGEDYTPLSFWEKHPHIPKEYVWKGYRGKDDPRTLGTTLELEECEGFRLNDKISAHLNKKEYTIHYFANYTKLNTTVIVVYAEGNEANYWIHLDSVHKKETPQS